APIISSAVSPFILSAISIPAIPAGSSLPSTSRSNRCAESSIGKSSPVSSLGGGLGTGREGSCPAGWDAAVAARVSRWKVAIWFMIGHLKQKSPPLGGGQSND